MRVLIVGQNPGPKNISTRAFHGVHSRGHLLEWLDSMGPYEYHIINASLKFGKVGLHDADPDLPFEDYDAVIALGTYAAAVLCIQECDNFMVLPHPSSLNRQLNSSEYVERKLGEAATWLRELC